MQSEVFDLRYMEQRDIVNIILSGEDEVEYMQLKKQKIKRDLQSEILGKKYIILNGQSGIHGVRYTIQNIQNMEI